MGGWAGSRQWAMGSGTAGVAESCRGARAGASLRLSGRFAPASQSLKPQVTIMRRFYCAMFGLLVLATNVAAEPIRFARYPHVSNDGTIAFSYHGDIWLVNGDGANPRRLTAHIARDINPRFSPDGRWVAFSSNRMGNNDVYVVPVTGGEPRQLTFHSGDDNVLYWTPDGRGIVIATNRGANPWGAPLHVVPLDGGLPTPLPMDMGRSGMVKQDNTLVAFNRSNFTYWRKGYRGNSSTDIDVLDLKSGDIRQITDTNLNDFRKFTQDAHP